MSGENLSKYESRASFEGDGRIDFHAADERLLSLEEARRRRELELSTPAVEQGSTPSDQLRRVSAGVVAIRTRHLDSFPEAA